MRLAILSDIHGNIHALTAVKRFLNEHAITQVIVLGDLVGYGASPGPVIDFVRREGWTCSLGSSDARVAFDMSQRAERRGVADTVLAWTAQTLAPEQMDFLRRLPAGGRTNTPVGRLRYFHGSPYDLDQRIDLMGQEREMEALAEQLGARVVVAGGTHVPFVRHVAETTFIDPGSVGLSLNHEPGADVVILELQGLRPKVSLHKVPYDYHSAAFDIMAWSLPPVIAEVIKTGRMG
ncbi:metallophosphoesterase family protein [Deinococcus sp. KNUC1210]|uniref:metallophosphoesterase family protein n=1 Tax=Deinococcus sp. KNUC1210 TaxID=2917691 RepID=UPI001EEF7DE8|nr:metallophosphoesterase family protein [Deinococcus sp. KNUC1210]ULH15949.1 metallophosphoesterase family protein [Deinococcus sp. KNUC1210]